MGSFADPDSSRRGSQSSDGRRGSTNPDGSRKSSADEDGVGGSRKGSSDPLRNRQGLDGRRDSTNPDGSRKSSEEGGGGRGLLTDPNARRKASTDPDSMHGLLPDGSIPEGTAVISVVKARGLAKADMIGKSDPYAVLVYGKQQQKTPVVNNTLEPQWDFTAEFMIPDDGDETIYLEVFDKDRIGKDKSLGSLNLPLVDVLDMDGQEGNWFPLAGSKDGEILLMADFVDAEGNDSRGRPSALSKDLSNNGERKNSSDPMFGRKGSGNNASGHKEPKDGESARRGSANPLDSNEKERRGSTEPYGIKDPRFGG